MIKLIAVVTISSLALSVGCVPGGGGEPRQQSWYIDLDGDGWGDENDQNPILSAYNPSGGGADYSIHAWDCNDSDNTIHPFARIQEDGIDHNCDDVPDVGFKYIFVTSTVHNGNLGGLSGADAICQSRADASNLLPAGGVYKAWLSSSSVNAADRLNHNAETYIFPGWEQGLSLYNDWHSTIADHGWNALTDNNGTFGGNGWIERNELGVEEVSYSGTGSPYVWTNSQVSGALFLNDASCLDWTTNSDTVDPYVGTFRSYAVGSVGVATWTLAKREGCETFNRLYCLEQ